jgi:predicted RNA-binding Zn ribbon-like protein
MLTSLTLSAMTGQVLFDSHVENLLLTTALLSNRLCAGRDGGHPVAVPDDDATLRTAVRDVLEVRGYRLGRRSPSIGDARRIADAVAVARRVIEAIEGGDLPRAARLTNRLLLDTGARPQLDADQDGAWGLHFHGPDDSLGVGWSAGIAAGLAMALGTPDAGRLGVCAAESCDRVYLDASRNGGRQFCSTRCQSRTKAAAHRARRGARGTGRARS